MGITNKNINILFLGGAKRVSIASHFINEGAKRNIHIRIFSYELEAQVPIASIGEVIIGKKWNDIDLYDNLLEIVKKKKINIILPFVDPAIAVASKMKKLCPSIFIPVSDINLCELMFDKVLSAKWYAENNISQPNIYYSSTKLKYPVILKPRTGSASKGIIICRSEKDIPNTDLTQYIIQDYIEKHTEFSVDCYVSQKGIITSIVPRIRLETVGGEVSKSRTIKDNTIISESQKILKSGLFRGPVTIQYIKDDLNGNIYIMEINPRLGGGVVTSIGAGSGIIDMILDEYEGKPITPKTDWKDNTTMVRFFSEVIFYADCY